MKQRFEPGRDPRGINNINRALLPLVPTPCYGIRSPVADYRRSYSRPADIRQSFLLKNPAGGQA